MFVEQIETLAMELAEAMTESNAASAAVDAAEERRAKIASRVAALAEEREDIIGRRSTGRHDLDDGGALTLIQADSEGLKPILQEAAARVNQAEAERSVLAARAAQLRERIAHVEAEAARAALVRHADELSNKLFDTIRALDEACRRTGHTGRPLWGAPPALYHVLRGLAAQRGEL
jgi:chromosome segregation ATPase